MINYDELNQYNINVENVKKYYDTSKQVKKFVDAILDENELRYKKMLKIPKLKALLKNLEDWFCNCCNTQLKNITAYNKHLNSPQHKEKQTGEKMVSCSNPKCRKKMMESELENHLKLNPKCVWVSPKNKHIVEIVDIKAQFKRINYLKDKEKDNDSIWSKEEKEEYNKYMLKNQRDCNNKLSYDDRGLLYYKNKNYVSQFTTESIADYNKQEEEEEETLKPNEIETKYDIDLEELERITNQRLQEKREREAIALFREMELNEIKEI